jgi:hypothetical protein
MNRKKPRERKIIFLKRLSIISISLLNYQPTAAAKFMVTRDILCLAFSPAVNKNSLFQRLYLKASACDKPFSHMLRVDQLKSASSGL